MKHTVIKKGLTVSDIVRLATMGSKFDNGDTLLVEVAGVETWVKVSADDILLAMKDKRTTFSLVKKVSRTWLVATGRRGAFTPKTGAPCSCRKGVERDNCARCEGTGLVIDYALIHKVRTLQDQVRNLEEQIADMTERAEAIDNGEDLP